MIATADPAIVDEVTEFGFDVVGTGAAGGCDTSGEGVVCETAFPGDEVDVVVATPPQTHTPIGDSTVQIEIEGANSSSVLIASYYGDAASAALGGSTGGDESELVSPVVDVVLPNGTATVIVTFRLQPEPIGGGSCKLQSLLQLVAGGVSDGCVAGCCSSDAELAGSNGTETGRACVCDSDTARGERCEKELRCSAQRDSHGERDDSACTTSRVAGSNAGDAETVVCQCTEIRRVAVFANRMLPKIRRSIGAENYASEVADASGGGGLAFLFGALLAYSLLALATWRLDIAAVYTARAPGNFYPTTLTELFTLHARIYATVFRPFNMIPSYVQYTRLQLLWLLITNLQFNACCALLFAGNFCEIRTGNLLAPRTLPDGQRMTSARLAGQASISATRPRRSSPPSSRRASPRAPR